VRGKLRDEKPMSDAAFDPGKDRPLPALARAGGRRAAVPSLPVAAE